MEMVKAGGLADVAIHSLHVTLIFLCDSMVTDYNITEYTQYIYICYRMVRQEGGVGPAPKCGCGGSPYNRCCKAADIGI